MFSTQTLSISQAQYSISFAPPITIKSVTLIVSPTLESCHVNHFSVCLQGMFVFSGYIFCLLIMIQSVSKFLCCDNIHCPFRPPVTISSPHSLASHQYISLSDIHFILVYCGACRCHNVTIPDHVGSVTLTVTLWPLWCVTRAWLRDNRCHTCDHRENAYLVSKIILRRNRK